MTKYKAAFFCVSNNLCTYNYWFHEGSSMKTDMKIANVFVKICAKIKKNGGLLQVKVIDKVHLEHFFIWPCTCNLYRIKMVKLLMSFKTTHERVFCDKN